ncbi:MAG: alpha amylase C-terminal domain-containing protein, partial [Flavobacteriaceae bacterium]
VLTFIRKGHDAKNDLIVACNFTPVPRESYRIGVPRSKQLKEIFNTDAKEYAGTGMHNPTLKPTKKTWHGQQYSVEITIPPLGMVVFK